MTEIYKYSIVRFRPFAETGEFANIGVVLVSLSTGELGYELAPRRFPRVRGFFDSAVHDAYSAAISSLTLELARATEYLPASFGNEGQKIFASITEKRESSIIYSEPRVVEGEGFQATLDKLFARLVKRDFSTNDTAEIALTRGIRVALRKEGLRQFRSVKLEDDVVPVVFPLAYRGMALRAIKPLAFAQKNPLGIFDYGAHWKRRLEYLLVKKKIKEGNVFLAVEPPTSDVDRKMAEAFETAIEELLELPFPVQPAQVGQGINPGILNFAFESFPKEARYLQ